MVRSFADKLIILLPQPQQSKLLHTTSVSIGYSKMSHLLGLEAFPSEYYKEELERRGNIKNRIAFCIERMLKLS